MNISTKFEMPASTSALAQSDYAAQQQAFLEHATQAIRDKRMILAYQPVVHAHCPSRIAFYEGLIRIADPLGHIIPAKNFMPQLENTEFGRLIDCHALELGLHALRIEPNLRLSINMSARSVGYPKWIECLRQGLADNPRIAERLILEITEASVMAIPELIASFISDLQEYGISFALDDFGAGYTAFRFFRQFHFDIVKIDGQFIKNIHKDEDNQVLAAALVSIAKHFNMFIVAEHVETKEDMKHLQNIGVDCLQGFHTGRPELFPEWTVDLYQAEKKK